MGERADRNVAFVSFVRARQAREGAKMPCGPVVATFARQMLRSPATSVPLFGVLVLVVGCSSKGTPRDGSGVDLGSPVDHPSDQSSGNDAPVDQAPGADGAADLLATDAVAGDHAAGDSGGDTLAADGAADGVVDAAAGDHAGASYLCAGTPPDGGSDAGSATCTVGQNYCQIQFSNATVGGSTGRCEGFAAGAPASCATSPTCACTLERNFANCQCAENGGMVIVTCGPV
jgi:hypothetical protein